MTNVTPGPTDLVAQAKDVLRGYDPGPVAAFQLARRLAAQQRLEFASRIAEHIHADARLDSATRLEVFQKWALWTSKNPGEPDDIRHDEIKAREQIHE